MYSLAFRFERKTVPLLDPTGISRSNLHQAQVIDDETRLACKMVEAIVAARDVDQILAADQVLDQKIRAQSSRMMERARYDKLHYEEWIAAGCPTQEFEV